MKSPFTKKPLIDLMGLTAGTAMAMARLGTNMNIQVQATLGTPITDATSITQADPGVVTTTGAHGLSNGAIVRFAVTTGMVELNGQAARVANVTSTTFEIEGLDTTLYSAFAGSDTIITEVASFHTMNNAQGISMPDPAPNKVDITTLIDKVKQIAFGLPEAPDGNIPGLYDPQNAAVVAVKAATKTNTELVMKVNWAGGPVTLFNAQVSGGSGFDLQANDAAKANIAITPVKDVLDFIS